MLDLWYDSWCGRPTRKMMGINIFIHDVNIVETDLVCHYTYIGHIVANILSHFYFDN